MPVSKRVGLQTTIIVAMLSMIGPFTIDSVFPAFARIGVQFGASDAALQQITSIYLFAYAFASLFHGPISDAVGRKPVMIVGIAAFALASIGCAFAPSLGVLLAFRAVQGVFAGAGQIISRALVRDLYDGWQAQRVMAQISMIFGVAPALAPVVGGWLLAVGDWEIIFIFLTGYTVLLLLLVTFGLPESHPADKRTPLRLGPIFSGMREVATDGPFARLAFASSLAFSAQFLYIAGAPIFIVRLLGLGERDFWVFFVPMITGMILGSFINSRLAEWGHPEKVASIGLGIMLCAIALNVGLAASGLASQLPWPIVGPALIAFGMSLAFPILQLTMLDLFPSRRGTAASLQSFVSLLLNALLAGVIIPLVSGSIFSLALASCVFGVSGSGLWAWHLASARRGR